MRGEPLEINTRPAETGAVLVEALVAMLIIAAMSGLWFETLGGAAARQRATADRRLAMLVAQSQMATVGVLQEVAPGAVTGSNAGMDWRIAIEPDEEEGPGFDRVVVTVGKPGLGTLATLQTLRLGQ